MRHVKLDKVMHFLAGFFIAASAQVLGLPYPIVYSAVAGIVKEVYDFYDKDNTKEDVEFMDFLATFSGGLLFVVYVMMGL